MKAEDFAWEAVPVDRKDPFSVSFLDVVRGRAYLPVPGARPTVRRPKRGWPLVVLQHGYIATAQDIGPTGEQVECRGEGPLSDWRDYPESFRGFEGLAEAVASLGVLVLSLDAREIDGTLKLANDNVSARVAQISHAAMVAGRRFPIDLRRTVLIGHSNGGSASILAADYFRRDGSWLGIDVEAVIAMDPNPAHDDYPVDLGDADLLVVDAGCDVPFPNGIAAVTARAPTRGETTVLTGNRFHHQAFNSEWMELLGREVSGECAPFWDPCTLEGGWSLERQERVTRCYAMALVRARLFQESNSRPPLRSLPPRLPGVGVGDLTRLEHHA